MEVGDINAKQGDIEVEHFAGKFDLSGQRKERK